MRLFHFLKRAWIVCFLLSLAIAQDVQIPTNAGTPYVVLGRHLSWTATGIGSINNNFVFTPQFPDSGYCLQMLENPADANAHTVQLTVYQSQDPSSTTFTAAPGNFAYIWNAVTLNIAGGGTYFIPGGSASRVSFNFSSGTGAGFVDVVIAQTQPGNSGICSQGAANVGIQGAPIVCTASAHAAVASAATARLVAGNPGRRIHVCSWDITAGGAVAITDSTNQFFYATGATCNASIRVVAQVHSGATTSFVAAQQATRGELFGSGPAVADGAGFCYTDGGTVSGTWVNISYAEY